MGNMKTESELEIILRDRLKGYHFEIMFYPAGGIVEVAGCSDSCCGTNDTTFASQSWKISKGQSLQTAIDSIIEKLRGA